MTDWEKLADLLDIAEERRESLFNDLVNRNTSLVLFFNENGSIDWGTPRLNFSAVKHCAKAPWSVTKL